jgi:hypothetical protein
LNEHFEKVGGPGLNELVLRYNVPAGTQALYIGRDGSITLSAIISQTTPDTAILVKSTHNGNGVNPTVENYRNKRRIRHKFTGVKQVGSNPTFDYDFAVDPDYIDARKVAGGATGALHQIAQPAVVFDGQVTVLGLNDGDNYIIECEA